MAAVAEISIAHDVYDHVQRQSLAFHLSRETGKIIRIVSKGSQSFSAILRMIWFNLAPILV
jgi:ABC-type transport system involved in Fe-S cluster assembly fused permease/ATPase subunit